MYEPMSAHDYCVLVEVRFALASAFARITPQVNTTVSVLLQYAQLFGTPIGVRLWGKESSFGRKESCSDSKKKVSCSP